MKFLAVLVVVAGCVSFDEAGLAPGDAGEATLAAQLADREERALEPPSLVGVAAFDGAGRALPCLQPDVLAGRAVLRSDDGLLLVEAMDIELSDVRIEAGVVYDRPIDLTDIELRLGTQIVVEAHWSADGRAAHGSGRADLLMDWALIDQDGAVLPLATQLLRDVEFAVDARLGDDGEVTAAVRAAVDGTVRRFGDTVELADFSMAVSARGVP
jgi:hypothetical protein